MDAFVTLFPDNEMTSIVVNKRNEQKQKQVLESCTTRNTKTDMLTIATIVCAIRVLYRARQPKTTVSSQNKKNGYIFPSEPVALQYPPPIVSILLYPFNFHLAEKFSAGK